MAAATTPISTENVFLMYKASSSAQAYTKLCDIKDFGDIVSKPEDIEVTSLSDHRHIYIPGLESGSSIDFTANYISSTYDTIKALEGDTPYEFEVQFGTGGENGTFDFEAKVSVSIPGKGVGEAIDMVITLYPTTTIVKS